MNRPTKINALPDHEPNHHVPHRTASLHIVVTSGKKASERSRSFGYFYTIHFPLSRQERSLSPPAVALEKILVYSGLVLLLAFVAVTIPFIEIIRFVKGETWPAYRYRLPVFLVAFVPLMLVRELAVCLGFITIPTLLLCNTASFFARLVKPLF